jgi:hypothetical protein
LALQFGAGELDRAQAGFGFDHDDSKWAIFSKRGRMYCIINDWLAFIVFCPK